jgi:hypothetical protein
MPRPSTVASNLNVSPSVRPLYRRWPYDYIFNGSPVMVMTVISPWVLWGCSFRFDSTTEETLVKSFFFCLLQFAYSFSVPFVSQH